MIGHKGQHALADAKACIERDPFSLHDDAKGRQGRVAKACHEVV